MYLIDGNNVMGQRVGWHRDKPAARQRLLEELARLAQTKAMKLAVVFDGTPDTSFPDGSRFRGVQVFYARYGADADARIIELVERERNRKGLIVVTSDRALTDRVRACGVRVMRSGALRRMLDELPAAPGPAAEPVVRKEEMASWLRYFGVDESDAEE